MRIVAPSILSANFLELDNEINKINNSNAEWIHFDVMDGHFVPNISFGPDIFKFYKNNSDLFMDVHIMVSNPMFVAELFVKAGAHQVVFHLEAVEDIDEALHIIDYLHENNVKAGLAIKPKTDVLAITPLLSKLDLVLVMSVEPGFGGQKFIKTSLDKVRLLDELRIDYKYNYLIQIDGGIDNTNKEECYEAGVDCLVAGSYLFKQDDFAKAVDSLL
ncbi:MAG: ribulose-phosphate 3-epimerase [Erysipelotrichales bacterium]